MRYQPVFRGLMALIAGLLCLLVLELFANVVFVVREGSLYYLTDVARPAHEQESSPTARNRLLNPYFSHSRRPGLSVFSYLDSRGKGIEELRAKTGSEELPDWADVSCNNFGFFSEYDVPHHDDESFVIGIFGGSVAQWFSLQGQDVLKTRLTELGLTRGRPPLVLNFGHGGYKQPQQLLVLSYFLSIGQRFDLIVNIDGFNEAVFGVMNLSRGIDASLPNARAMQALRTLLESVSDDESLLFLARFTELDAELKRLQTRRADAATALTYLIADSRLRIVQSRLLRLESSPPEPGRQTSAILVPDVEGEQRTSPRSIARDWRRASEMMAELARFSRAHYIHVLQPNQYHGERRPSDAGRRAVARDGNLYSSAVPTVYPLLLDEGRRLRQRGVDFHDGEEAFTSVPEPVYSDACCHYNQRGNEVLADFIAERLRVSLAEEVVEP